MALRDKWSSLRDASWLNGRNIRLYLWLVLAVALPQFIARIVTSHDLISRDGVPLGGDYISFYAASKLALSGQVTAPWHQALHHVAETAVFGRNLGYWAFFYPPAYLLVCLPLALLPYGWSMSIAMAVTSIGWLIAMRRWVMRIAPGIKAGYLPLLAFPGLWLNIACGQNGALTAMILAAGCCLLPVSSIGAGLVLGLAVIKPQLAVAIPFVLLASGRWKALVAAGISAASLSLMALAVVGPDGYLAFFANGALARAALEKGLVDSSSMQSLFGAMKVLGAPTVLAYIAQAALGLAVLGRACYVAWRCRPDASAIGALMVSAGLLLSPFMLDYDLMVSTVPLAWLVMRGVSRGFQPWEKISAVFVFILPLIARGFAGAFHLPVAWLILLGLFLVVQRRITIEAAGQEPAGDPLQTLEIKVA